MRPIGYLYKPVAPCPDWLKAKSVVDIHALSGCLSRDFADYINDWRHNGYWLFDRPDIMREHAAEHALSLEDLQLLLPVSDVRRGARCHRARRVQKFRAGAVSDFRRAYGS